MPDKILLQSGNARAVVSRHGGWLESLEVGQRIILFPKQEFILPDGTKKIRGGCHVCLPNFGPGGGSGQPQHGFARDIEWVIDTVSSSKLRFVLERGEGEYAGLSTSLVYALKADEIEMVLNVSNKSVKPLRVSPGFHPYFAYGSEGVLLDGARVDVTNLHEPHFLEVTPKRLRVNDLTYEFEVAGLNNWVAWTDQLGAYVCIEPTQAGFSFLNNGTEDELLQPNVTKSWSYSLRWS